MVSENEPEALAEDSLGRARGGDMRAFEEVMVQHQRRVLMTALRLLGRLHDAQDASQEVFLRLYKYLHRFDEKRELSPWLYRVTVNVCRDIRKKRRRIDHHFLEIAVEDLADSNSLEEPPDRTREKKIIAQGLKKLSEKERAAIVLRDIEGLSTSETAQILGSSETTIRSHISRARLKLKEFRERILGRQS